MPVKSEEDVTSSRVGVIGSCEPSGVGFFEIGFPCVTQVDLKLTILLFQPQE